MPYKIKGKCIYKKDTGNKVGCTKGSVKKYMKALHANVKESLNECYECKGVIMTDDKSEASVFFELTKVPGAELGLVFSMPEADYQYGIIRDPNNNKLEKFDDPLRAKDLLSRYGLTPHDVEEEMYQQAYEKIQNDSENSRENSLNFESLYKQIMDV